MPSTYAVVGAETVRASEVNTPAVAALPSAPSKTLLRAIRAHAAARGADQGEATGAAGVDGPILLVEGVTMADVPREGQGEAADACVQGEGERRDAPATGARGDRGGDRYDDGAAEADVGGEEMVGLETAAMGAAHKAAAEPRKRRDGSNRWAKCTVGLGGDDSGSIGRVGEERAPAAAAAAAATQDVPQASAAAPAQPAPSSECDEGGEEALLVDRFRDLTTAATGAGQGAAAEPAGVEMIPLGGLGVLAAVAEAKDAAGAEGVQGEGGEGAAGAAAAATPVAP